MRLVFAAAGAPARCNRRLRCALRHADTGVGEMTVGAGDKAIGTADAPALLLPH
jgi:hypothetical protein